MALVCIASIILIPVAVLLIEVLAAIFIRSKTRTESSAPGAVCVLVPAHNEEAGITSTITSIRSNLVDSSQILVVADNCDDDTAKNARSAGAVVIERFNSDLRGKGYALAFGIAYLRSSSPDVVIVIDADCVVNSGGLLLLAAAAHAEQRPMQAHYQMDWPQQAAASVQKKITSLAWHFKNYVRPLGLSNLGLPCQLMGSGMAFPWKVISQLPLASGEIVEDMKVGVDSCLIGAPAMFFPRTQVRSFFPSTPSAIASQRTRWEHGHVSLALRSGFTLVKGGFALRQFAPIALACDLVIPPLALLALTLLLGLGLAICSAIFTGAVLGLKISVISICLFVLSVALGWWAFGRHIIRAFELASVPVYILRKLPIYAKLFFNRQATWIRTKRDNE
jgi:Glycosyltransferase like family 2